jgi:hypothetical protein
VTVGPAFVLVQYNRRARAITTRHYQGTAEAERMIIVAKVLAHDMLE